MLASSRKSQEAVVVGGTGRSGRLSKVKVPEIDGGEVRLGFDGATAASLSQDGDPAAAGLLVVKAREKSAELKTAGGPVTGKDDPKERPECVASKKWACLCCGAGG